MAASLISFTAGTTVDGTSPNDCCCEVLLDTIGDTSSLTIVLSVGVDGDW